MVKYSELQTIFSELSFECGEYNIDVEDNISLPYCAYLKISNNSYSADSMVYFSIIQTRLILVDSDVNANSQYEIEELFDKYGVYYDKEIDYEEDDRIYTFSYDFETING